MVLLFEITILIQFVVVVVHDLIDIPGWTHGRQVRAAIGRRKLWIATGVNAIFPGIAAAFALRFWGRPAPSYATGYWLLYCAITVASAIFMWYVPYWLGASEKLKREYAAMYAGTRHVLPPRGDNPRPNLLHVCFHVLFLLNLALALGLQRRIW